mgnify:CR=1 FL=1
MQDKTINDVLLALYRTGESRVHVAAFMALMGIPAPNHVHDRPLVRGKCKRLASSLLLCTTSVVANAIRPVFSVLHGEKTGHLTFPEGRPQCRSKKRGQRGPKGGYLRG